jgi:hypothetical protein
LSSAYFVEFRQTLSFAVGVRFPLEDQQPNIQPRQKMTNQTPVTGERPRFIRFPEPSKRDPLFGLSRAWFYAALKRGWIKCAVTKMPGAKKGVALIDVGSVETFLASCTNNPEAKAADNSAAVARIKELSARKRKGRFPAANPKRKEASHEAPTP